MNLLGSVESFTSEVVKIFKSEGSKRNKFSHLDKIMPDLCNMCSDLDDLRVVSRVLGCAYVIGDVVQLAYGQGHMKVKFSLNHYFLNILS